jgi:glycerol-3-phosphate cytidylyltransferase
MINTFFNNITTKEIISKKFGTFIYNIDVIRNIKKNDTMNKDDAYEMLNIINKVSYSNDFIFFLTFGTCLGAIRDSNFISYDDDIDLGCYSNDKKKLIIVIDILLKEYNFQISKISKSEESITLVYKHITTDIGLYNIKDNYYLYNNMKRNRIPLKNLNNLKKIKFLNMIYNVPYYPEKYLEYKYGKNWKVPIKHWNNYNKYFSIKILNYLRSIKQTIKNAVFYIKNKKYLVVFKLGLKYSHVLNHLAINNIKNVTKSGQGFCDTFIINANKNIVLKVNNKKRFEYFKKDFNNVEPIYTFLEYKERFEYEKLMFEKFNNLQVYIFNDIIVFPFIKNSKPLSYYIGTKNFYIYLKQAIYLLKKQSLSHGDFHIENILIADNQVCFIDFEMSFSNYLSKKEQFYYDIYYLFAKLEYQYTEYFNKNFDNLIEFISQNFTKEEKMKIINISNKTKKYFFSVNGARIELFR